MVAAQIEKLQVCLTSENYDERLNAATSTAFEPRLFSNDLKVLQPMATVISEDLHEPIPNFCRGI